MAIYTKAIEANDIINGLVTVQPKAIKKAGSGTTDVKLHYDPAYAQHLASGDSLNTFQVLDGRFTTDPTYWSA